MENEVRPGNTPGNQDALLMSSSRRFELFNAVISKGISPTTGSRVETEETEGTFFLRGQACIYSRAAHSARKASERQRDEKEEKVGGSLSSPPPVGLLRKVDYYFIRRLLLLVITGWRCIARRSFNYLSFVERIPPVCPLVGRVIARAVTQAGWPYCLVARAAS